MRGPGDEASHLQGAVLERDEGLAPRPPGGKALLRLVELLEADGYADLAREVIELAVPVQDVSEVIELVTEMGITAAPTGDDGGGDDGGGDGGDGGATSRSSAPSEASIKASIAEAIEDHGLGVAPEIGHAYLEAAEAAEVAAALEVDRMGPPTASGPQWRSCGPWTITDGQTYGATRINASGRVSALVVDPSRPAHVLAGGAHGGVWESFDRGASWAPRTDYQPRLTVGALTFDPSAPATVYCGTGEGNWWGLGMGVLRSTNGGTTWSTLCTAPFVGDGFYSLVVDPGNRQRLYAGTRGGLWVSTNGGANWTRPTGRTAPTYSISLRATEVLAGCRDGLFRSTDNGVTWTAVALPGVPATFQRLAVAIAPSNAAVAYAWGAANGSPFLWRRSGGTWSAMTAPSGVDVGQAWYDWHLAVAPDSATQIYCGAIDLHRGTQMTVLGITSWAWTNLSSKASGGNSIHPDQHALTFETGAPARIYAGNDGGVYRSDDRGINWVHCNNGLQVSEFQYIAHNVGASRWLVGGTQDNGTNRWLGPATWEHVSDADGGDCGVNRANPQVVFHTRQWWTLGRSTTGGATGSWTWITPARPAGEGNGLFYPPFECSAGAGNTVAMGGQALYVSRDLGTAWRRLAFPGGGTASALYIPDADTVLVGLTGGQVLRSRFSSGVWGALVALTAPRANAWISDLHAEPGASGRIWATSSTVGGGRVFRSDNGGTAWTDLTAGLPDLPIHAVEVDPADRRRIWVGADRGVFQSRDSGATWADFSASLPNALVGDLVFHPHARVLRAGTRSRGVWEIPVDGWMTTPACGVQWRGTLASNETRRWFTFGWPATWHIIWTVMPTTPRPGAPQIGWTVEVERGDPERATYWITVRNRTPQPLQFEGRYAILSRY
jgi:hypothetical protein